MDVLSGWPLSEIANGTFAFTVRIFNNTLIFFVLLRNTFGSYRVDLVCWIYHIVPARLGTVIGRLNDSILRLTQANNPVPGETFNEKIHIFYPKYV